MPEPPAPRDADELARVQHTRLRRRMLYGFWRQDLVERIRKTVGSLKQEAWGEPDMSSCILRSAVVALAVLYDRPPAVSHDDASAAGLVDLVNRSGLWSLMKRVQRDTLGLREMLIRVDVDDAGRPIYTLAYPDLVSATPDPDRPDRAIRIDHAILRRRVNGDLVWTYDRFDVADPKAPRWQVVDAQSGLDLSPEFLRNADGAAAPEGGFVGDAYPYRWADKMPFLPFVWYHASRTGCLWDPYEARELVDGSLSCSVLWTFWVHCVRTASWPQRLVINARLPAVSIDGDDEKRGSIVSDPAVILELETNEESSGQIAWGQFQPGADPEKLQGAISMYERRVAAFAGVSPADVQRVAGDPRSGHAISITREGQREAQRGFEPQFRESDEALLAMVAAISNRATGSTYPEDGYRLAYEAIPMSAEERQSAREDMLARIAAGLLDKVSAYVAEHPGVSRVDAERALEEIARINARYRAAA
jgi:hypothetical protein